MTLRRPSLYLLAVALLVAAFLTGTAHAASKALSPLTKLAAGESWYLILLQDEPTGFLHLTTRNTADGYAIDAESSVKIKVMGVSREAVSRESYTVNPDLTLRSLQVEQTLDGSRTALAGEKTPQGLKVTVRDASGTKEKIIKARGALYPPPAVNLYPLFKGFSPGKKYPLQIFDAEDVKIKTVTVKAVASEQTDGKNLLHLTNDLYPFVSNDVWVDPVGITVRESVRDGLVETRLESPQTVRKFIAEAAISRRDLIFDFSLIRIEPPLAHPAETAELTVVLSRYPEDAPLPEGPGTTAHRAGETVTVEVRRVAIPGESRTASPEGVAAYLAPADRIPSDHPEIVTLKNRIAGEQRDPVKVADLLSVWVAKNIAGSATDSRSPLETLQERTGNCQAHARLYTALARAAGIPTRFVSGLVYGDPRGFLYHSWAESYLGGTWVPVDPTFGQIPADATHIRIAEGESVDDMARIAPLVGRVGARIVASKP